MSEFQLIKNILKDYFCVIFDDTTEQNLKEIIKTEKQKLELEEA